MGTDYLRECMTDPALVNQPVPIDQFSRIYCVVCGYKPCVRSRANTMVFTERVANWRPRLFTEVPRAEDSDPNYARIRAKNFQSVDEPLAISNGEAFAKNFAPIPQPTEPLAYFEPDRPAEPIAHQILTPPSIPSTSQPLPLTPPVSVNAPHQEPTLDNTPFGGGIILPGKPVDKKEDKLMDPGSTFTFGDDE
jgi:hypothetical protein